VSLSWWESRWPTRKTLRTLDGGVTTSLKAIRSLLEEKTVSPPELKGHIAWGQYLDDAHRSDEHWGRFGTSSAVVALALIDGRDDHPPKSRSILKSYPLDRVAPVIPESWPASNPERKIEKLEAIRKKDFTLIMKLAYMVDALKPDRAIVQGEEQPQLIKYLTKRSPKNMAGWTTRPTKSSHGQRDRHVPTTYILWALRRFPAAQEKSVVKEAYDWLARELRHDKQRMGIDLIALAGLALHRASPQINEHAHIQKALIACDARVEAWVRKQDKKKLALERPYFNGYSQGSTTDYIILSPELLCAIYLLDRGNPPRTRKFVLKVVSEVNENVAPKTIGGVDGPVVIPRGFCVQNGMIRTADQMWVVELLKTFRRTRQQSERRLLPPKTGWLSAPRALGIVAIVALLLYILLTVIDNSQSSPSLLAIVAAIALMSVSIFVELANMRSAR